MSELPEPTDDIAIATLRSAVMRLARRLRHQRVEESLTPTEMQVLATLARCGSATPGSSPGASTCSRRR